MRINSAWHKRLEQVRALLESLEANGSKAPLPERDALLRQLRGAPSPGRGPTTEDAYG